MSAVAPRAGAWIETMDGVQHNRFALVASTRAERKTNKKGDRRFLKAPGEGRSQTLFSEE
jgi:hypothetical protein